MTKQKDKQTLKQQTLIHKSKTQPQSQSYQTTLNKCKLFCTLITLIIIMSSSIAILTLLIIQKRSGILQSTSIIPLLQSTTCTLYILQKYTASYYELKLKVGNLALAAIFIITLFLNILLIIRRCSEMFGCCGSAKTDQQKKQQQLKKLKEKEKQKQKHKNRKEDSQNIQQTNRPFKKKQLKSPLLLKSQPSQIQNHKKEEEQPLINFNAPISPFFIGFYLLALMLLIIPLGLHLSFFIQWMKCDYYDIKQIYLYIFIGLEGIGIIMGALNVFLLIKQKRILHQTQQNMRIKKLRIKKIQKIREKNIQIMEEKKKIQVQNKEKQTEKVQPITKIQNQPVQPIKVQNTQRLSPPTVNIQNVFPQSPANNNIPQNRQVVPPLSPLNLNSSPVASPPQAPIQNTLQIHFHNHIGSPMGGNNPSLFQSSLENQVQLHGVSNSLGGNLNTRKNSTSNSESLRQSNRGIPQSRQSFTITQINQQRQKLIASYGIEKANLIDPVNPYEIYNPRELNRSIINNDNVETIVVNKNQNRGIINEDRVKFVSSVNNLNARGLNLESTNTNESKQQIANASVRNNLNNQIQMIPLNNKVNSNMSDFKINKLHGQVSNQSYQKVKQFNQSFINNQSKKLSQTQQLQARKKKLGFSSNIYAIQQSAPGSMLSSNVNVTKSTLNRFNSTNPQQPSTYIPNQTYQKFPSSNYQTPPYNHHSNLHNSHSTIRPQQRLEDRFQTNRKQNYQMDLLNTSYQLSLTEKLSQRFPPTDQKIIIPQMHLREESYFKAQNNQSSPMIQSGQIGSYPRNLNEHYQKYQFIQAKQQKNKNQQQYLIPSSKRAVPLKQQVYSSRHYPHGQEGNVSGEQTYRSGSSYYHNSIKREVQNSGNRIRPNFDSSGAEYQTNHFSTQNITKVNHSLNSQPFNANNTIDINKVKMEKNKLINKQKQVGSKYQMKIDELNRVETGQIQKNSKPYPKQKHMEELDHKVVEESIKYVTQNNYNSVLEPVKQENYKLRVKLEKQKLQDQKKQNLKQQWDQIGKEEQQRQLRKKQSEQRIKYQNHQIPIVDKKNWPKLKQKREKSKEDKQKQKQKNHNQTTLRYTNKINYQYLKQTNQRPRQISRQIFQNGEPIIIINQNPYSDQDQTEQPKKLTSPANQYKQNLLHKKRRNSEHQIQQNYLPVMITPGQRSISQQASKKKNIYSSLQKKMYLQRKKNSLLKQEQFKYQRPEIILLQSYITKRNQNGKK